MLINEKTFIGKLKESLNNHLKNRDLDAWFFNDYSDDDNLGYNDEINKYINDRIPGKWKMTGLYGNGTNVGEGVFWNDEYCIELHLSCWNEEEEYIDEYDILS